MDGDYWAIVFIGVAIGLLACELAAEVPPALAVGAAAVMEMTLSAALPAQRKGPLTWDFVGGGGRI